MHTHRCAFVVRLEPGTRNFTPVSSPWMTRDRRSRVCINSYSGVSNSDARNSQSPSVEDAIVTPDRASWPASRCMGVWSANLAVTTWANRPCLSGSPWRIEGFRLERCRHRPEVTPMLFDSIFQKYLAQRPVAVMTRATLEHAFAAQTLDEIFEQTAQEQYTEELTFSTVVAVLQAVVFQHRPCCCHGPSHRQIQTSRRLAPIAHRSWCFSGLVRPQLSAQAAVCRGTRSGGE